MWLELSEAEAEFVFFAPLECRGLFHCEQHVEKERERLDAAGREKCTEYREGQSKKCGICSQNVFGNVPIPTCELWKSGRGHF